MSKHRWHVRRAGGVDQIAITSGDDLAHLDDLDPKLWMALSIPTKGIELDPRMLALLDTDRDGYVRYPEVLAAVAWLRGVYKDPGDVLAGDDVVMLDKLQDGPVRASARRVLANLGKPAAVSVTIADTTNAEKLFSDTLFNGDGVIPVEAADGDVRQTVSDIIATHGSLRDRSGKPGIDKPRSDAFFSEARAVIAWRDQADAATQPFGDATSATADAVRAVRAKIDDFFTRCRLAAFDPRAKAALDVSDAELTALAAKELSRASADVAHLPLARVEPDGALSLERGLNPAWLARITTLATTIAKRSLTEPEWMALLERLAPYEAWLATKPATKVESLGLDRLRAAVAHEAAIADLIARDLALEPEVDAIELVEKLCRCQRDLATLLDNYVNFSAFYGRKGGVFQAGTLYLDGRGCQLVVEVTDPAKHALIAPMSGTYLAYCDCTRGGEKKTIAAAFTAGSVDNVFVGRNGVFVDRKGHDWQATITKVIDNPLSIRQAFWAPYKRFARALEERAAKRAAAADAAADAKLAGAVTTADPKKIDVGTVAALGVAVGGVGVVLTAIFSRVFGLGWWAPLGILGILVAISTPSMVVAYIKLRRRNLGPLLDANGWAVNALTRINIPFGTALTDCAALPAHAKRDRRDPYPGERRPWKLYAAAAVLALAFGWYTGRFDRYVPDEIKSTTVFGNAKAEAGH